MRKLRSVEAEALAMMRTKFQSACFVKEHRPDPPTWAPIPAPVRCHTRGTKTPVFEKKKKLISREHDRPFETAPKTTRESSSTKSRRACIPSRVTRLRRLIKLSSSNRLIGVPSKKRYESVVAQSSSRARDAAAARPSCMLLGASSPFQPKRTCYAFS